MNNLIQNITMTIFLSAFFTFAMTFDLNAQLTNGDFANFCQTGNAFQINNCVQNWRNSHGTPTLSTAGGGSAWMWSYSGRGEGIVANYSFQSGQTYQISFSIRTDNNNVNDPNVANNATVNLEAANGVPQNNASTFPTVNNSEVIFSNNMGPYLNTWQTVSLCYTPTGNFSQLWIYPFMANNSTNGSQSEMQIDDITIEPVNSASTNFWLSASSNNAGQVTVSTTAYPTNFPVNHWWEVYYAPNGNTSGNTEVPGNPLVCCSSLSATFSSNMYINEWYYIKHGIWNDCLNWRETRKKFRVQVLASKDGKEDYRIEVEDVYFDLSDEYIEEMDEMIRGEFGDVEIIDDRPNFVINSYTNESLDVAPNPAFDHIRIITDSNTDNEIQILNVQGELIYSDYVVEKADAKINVNHLPAGTYYVKVISANGEIQSSRFVKM